MRTIRDKKRSNWNLIIGKGVYRSPYSDFHSYGCFHTPCPRCVLNQLSPFVSILTLTQSTSPWHVSSRAGHTAERLHRPRGPVNVSSARAVLEYTGTLFSQGFEAIFCPWVGTYGCPFVYVYDHGCNYEAGVSGYLLETSRPCYRSVSALYLFGQTPVPLRISQEEELDGLSGVIRRQTTLPHVQQLRERLLCCQSNGSKVCGWPDVATCDASTLGSSPTEEYLNLESRAYWATVIWDASDSMTLNFRSMLSYGLKGACSEPVWELSESFLVDSSHQRTADWR
jgi:hypothetical protein